MIPQFVNMNTYFFKNNTALQKIIYQEMLNNPVQSNFSLPATRKRDFSFSIKSKYVTSVSR